MWLADVPGALRSQQLAATVDSIADWQLANGMIPWFPGGHADVWNHTEAAMALLLGGRRTEAERAFSWLAARQRSDGAWHRYYLADGVEEDKFDANCCAYPATGLWHFYRCTGDRAVLEAFWPMIDAALDFVVGLQTTRGEILWARHADGTPWSFALLTGSSSISLSLACGLRLAAAQGLERPHWEQARAKLIHVIRHEPSAFAPKHRWAMDWYYPVLVGALEPEVARRRLAEGQKRFVLEGRGVRCVADQPWVTAAETCECALAFRAAGLTAQAKALFGWAQAHRHEPSGRYWTGLVHAETLSSGPTEPPLTFPDQECSTYTAAAVVLVADALADASPAADLFRPEPFDLDPFRPGADAQPDARPAPAKRQATG